MWETLGHTNLTTWGSSEIKEFTGNFDDVYSLLPTFSQRVASTQLDSPHSQIVNKSRDIIVCDQSSLWEPVPVGMVSKRYQLIQHTDLFSGVRDSLDAVGINSSTVNIKAYLSEYGERASFLFELPHSFAFDPGDGEKLTPTLFCLNSVDGSFAFRLHVLLVRFICKNGMFIGEELSEYKHKHTKGLDPEYLFKYVTECVASIDKNRWTLETWIQTKVPKIAFSNWINTTLRDAWGVTAAARTFHIAMRGTDVQIDRNDKAETKASDRNVSDIGNVPGAHAPFTSLYDVSQALSWVASNNTNINKQLERQQDVKKLIDRLAAA